MRPTLRRFSSRLVVALAVYLVLGSFVSSAVLADSRPWPRTCPESNRFGFTVGGSNIEPFDVEQLHAGWYHSFTILATPSQKAGLGYVQTIRLSDDGPFPDKACSACPPWSALRGVVQANPNSLWIVGNEPDRQDYVPAERYAELYHAFYTFVKSVDPRAQVGIGGVVQPTPIRLQYLDQILDSYYAKYARSMPVDVWNIHHYLLREANDWGGGMPPGTDESLAIEYELWEHDMLEPHPSDPAKLGWKGHIIDLRRWMRDRGYQDRPLIITEYGILMPEAYYGYDYERVKTFMLNTFAWMLTATDENTGYPADNHRLVQSWAWYSLKEKDFEDVGLDSWSHLFDPDSKAITALGQDYGAYANSLSSPAIDLEPVGIRHSPPVPESEGKARMTVTAEVYNGGAATAQDVKVSFIRDGSLAGTKTIASLSAGETKPVSVIWMGLDRGRLYEVTIEVDPENQIAECDPLNNSLVAPLLVADQRLYLPNILKDH